MDVASLVSKLNTAVSDIRAGLKYGEAAKKYDIPVSILHTKILSMRSKNSSNEVPEDSKISCGDSNLSNSETSTMSLTPDENGLIVNEQLFHNRKGTKNRVNGIVVTKGYAMAIKEVLNGKSVGKTSKKYKLSPRTLQTKMKQVQGYRESGIVPLTANVNRLSKKRTESKSSSSSPPTTEDKCFEGFLKQSGTQSNLNAWQTEDVDKAVQEVKEGLSLVKAAHKYKISFPLLQAKCRHFIKEKNRKRLMRIKHSIANKSNDVDGDIGTSMEDISGLSGPIVSKRIPVCAFCHRRGYREEELGKLYVLKKIAAHYYCLLFSSALEQNGNDDQGVLGFLAKDILKESRRGAKLKCRFCSKNGATVGCSKSQCKMMYHFPCGLDKNFQFEFTDNFRSFCLKHRSFQKGKNLMEEVECPICCETLIADPKIAVWSPCCQPLSWFHKSCLRKLALSAGYFFKCPLCNDKNVFVKEMLCQGIFVPEKDASWELEPNAFQDQLERPSQCSAVACKCPGGREIDEQGSAYEVILCNMCGSTGVHLFCVGLSVDCEIWNCAECRATIKALESRSKKESKGKKRSLEEPIPLGPTEKKQRFEEGEPSSASASEVLPIVRYDSRNTLQYFNINNTIVKCFPKVFKSLKKCYISIPKYREFCDSSIIVKKSKLESTNCLKRLDSLVIRYLDSEARFITPVKTDSIRQDDVASSNKENNIMPTHNDNSSCNVEDILSQSELDVLSKLKTPTPLKGLKGTQSYSSNPPKVSCMTLDSFLYKDNHQRSDSLVLKDNNQKGSVEPKSASKKRPYHRKKDKFVQKSLDFYFKPSA